MSGVTVVLTDEEAQWLVNIGKAFWTDSTVHQLGAKVEAALPAPIQWETHLGVEMARVGERLAMLVNPSDIFPFLCVPGDGLMRWATKPEAEEWLRDGAV